MICILSFPAERCIRNWWWPGGAVRSNQQTTCQNLVSRASDATDTRDDQPEAAGENRAKSKRRLLKITEQQELREKGEFAKGNP